MPELKLLALDADDLNVVSAHLQDAVARVSDLAYLPTDKRFVAMVNRFDWLGAEETGSGTSWGRRKKSFERRQTALRFDRVQSARHQGLDLTDTRRVLSLLAIQFEPSGEQRPDGRVTLVFSGACAIALEVECIECEMRDLGAAWVTGSRPTHAGDDSSA